MKLDRCIIGDCRVSMRSLIAAGVKVQTVVTSPPYWGLRDYGVPGQIGLERTPVRYVARLRSVFRLVRELLADDGVLWLNLGDCYATGAGKVGDHPGGGKQGARWRGDVERIRDAKRGYRGDRGGYEGKQSYRQGPQTQPNRMPIRGLKPKDLVGIPWRVAFALQADGWYLRNDIIWSKPNPMPESVRDRCTKSHEYIFLFAKSEQYRYDGEAIKEPADPANHRTIDSRRRDVPPGRNPDTGFANGRVYETRNKRSVWTVATTPFQGAHFATFPEQLIEPCILAGSGPGDTVFDPFMGAGTVAAVAARLGRHWLGCELNPDYAAMMTPRVAQQGMQFVTTEVES
jgi:site-specific DNA-methyltransferase (cytosine-N4-specific)